METDKNFVEHIKEVSKTKKIKNPVIGFLLVLFLGPFGFLYYSWQTAIKVILILLGLVILASIFLPTALPSWVKFVVLPILAIYAYQDIKWWNSTINFYKNQKDN